MRTSTLLCIITIILLAGCVPKQETVTPPGQPAQPGQPAVPPQIIYEPPTVSLTADKTTAELTLSTTLHCVAGGSDGNYTYVWTGLPTACTEKDCAIQLDTFGNHSIRCDVITKQGTRSASLTLGVKKRMKPIRNVYVFGDSLSYGHGLVNPGNESWPVLYTRTFKDATLHNYAVSGADTPFILDAEFSKFRNESPDTKESLVFVWIGANDIQHFISTGDFDRNYRMIIDRLRPEFKDIIVMTVPDVSKLSLTSDIEQGVNQFLSGFGVNVSVTRISQDIVKDYNRVIVADAAEYELPVIDMFDFMQTLPDSILSTDRIHPNKEGHVLIAKRVQSDVISFYPKDELIDFRQKSLLRA